MTYKEEQLINKGYDKNMVFQLCRVKQSELEDCVNLAIKMLTRDVNSVDNPTCVYIGGQPGSGKSVFSDNLKKNSNSVELSMDACRMFHPNYEKIEACIHDFYSSHDITSENNPGNDIASFTQDFSSMMINMLIDRVSNKKYNILLEWNMRNSTDVLSCMAKLHNKGYKNEAVVIAVDKTTSFNACKLRADVMNSFGHIARRVPKSFHDLCIDTIPKNVDIINYVGKKTNILDCMKVLSRDGKIKWKDSSDLLPSNVLNEIYYNSTLQSDNSYELAEMSYIKESIGLLHKKEKIDNVTLNVS